MEKSEDEQTNKVF